VLPCWTQQLDETKDTCSYIQAVRRDSPELSVKERQRVDDDDEEHGLRTRGCCSFDNLHQSRPAALVLEWGSRWMDVEVEMSVIYYRRKG
jgi:hypothetical protein